MKKNLKLFLAALTALGLMGVATACSTEQNSESNGNSQVETPAVEYTVTFVADGETIDTITYVEGAESVTEPEVPVKAHYTGAWEAYELNGNVTVNAVYTAVEYTVTFVAEGVTVGTATYTVESTEITEPEVPAKEHYTGAWEAYELDFTNATVNAAYTAIEYTITFNHPRTGMPLAAPIKYTIENIADVVFPAVPEDLQIPGKTVAWNKTEADVKGGDLQVVPVWDCITYTITFKSGDEVVGTATYTVESTEITEPAVPAKEGYTGAWGEYSLSMLEDQTVEPVYTANTYKITYNANGGTVESEEQAVTYNDTYVLPTPTAGKIYQEFLGWQDEEGNTWAMQGEWTMAFDVTLTAKYSNAVTFDSATSVPSFLQNGGRAALSIVDGNGGKVLQATAENNDQGNVRIMMSLADMAQFFEDPSVQYMAFDLKLPAGATTPVSSIMYHNLEQSNYMSYETGDPGKSGSQFDTTPTDAFKSYYLPRSVYEAWVANGKTDGRFLNVQAGITYGASYWIDNIRPVTKAEYTADTHSFETGALRNMTTEIGYCTPNYNQFHFKITGVNASNAKFTNEIVSDGMRAIQFTKNAGDSVIMFNNNSDPEIELASRAAGYISFDLYVPEGSDAKIKHQNQSWYGALKTGWNTVYEKIHATDNNVIRFVDTTASTYVLDNIRLLTEEEYNAAMFGFEAGGVLRDNNSNDATANSGWMYYYAGADKMNNKCTIGISEGNGEKDVATLSNVRFATEKTHGGDYSLAFDKKAGYLSMHMAADSAMYSYMKNGFTFWIYSTVELDGTGTDQFINGVNAKFEGGNGIIIPANTWTKVTVTAADIHTTAGRFLILQGQTEGTIYIDDFQPLP